MFQSILLMISVILCQHFFVWLLLVTKKLVFIFFNSVDFQIFESLDLQSSWSISIMPFGLNYILHDHDMWVIIDDVESCDVVEPSANLDFFVELDPTFFTIFTTLMLY